MLVPVEYKGVSTWVRVPKTEDVYNYPEFVQGGNISVMLIHGFMAFHGFGVCLKEQLTLKSKIHIFPLTCTAISIYMVLC